MISGVSSDNTWLSVATVVIDINTELVCCRARDPDIDLGGNLGLDITQVAEQASENGMAPAGAHTLDTNMVTGHHLGVSSGPLITGAKDTNADHHSSVRAMEFIILITLSTIQINTYVVFSMVFFIWIKVLQIQNYLQVNLVYWLALTVELT